MASSTIVLPRPLPQLPPADPILPLHVTKQGWAILRIPYSAVPDYDFEAATEGLTDEQIRQELEIDWNASSDKRVFPQFGEHHIAKRKIRFDPQRPLICGWDFGNTPAWIASQINTYGQWCILRSRIGDPDKATSMYDFGWSIADEIQEQFATPHKLDWQDLDIRHYGDPAGNAAPPKTQGVTNEKIELRSGYRILRDGIRIVIGHEDDGEPLYEEKPGLGWVIQPGAVDIRSRLEAVASRLNGFRDGAPLLLVDPSAEEVIRGFYGGYHYAQRLDGRYEDKPEKNWFSHVMDALQYPATRLFAAAPKRTEEEDDGRSPAFRSHAASRRPM